MRCRTRWGDRVATLSLWRGGAQTKVQRGSASDCSLRVPSRGWPRARALLNPSAWKHFTPTSFPNYPV